MTLFKMYHNRVFINMNTYKYDIEEVEKIYSHINSGVTVGNNTYEDFEGYRLWKTFDPVKKYLYIKVYRIDDDGNIIYPNR